MSVLKCLARAPIVMFLISSSSWGDPTTTKNWSGFNHDVHAACVRSFVREFKKWPAVTYTNARAIARVLCEDSRVFYDFAWAQDPQEYADKQVDDFNIRKHYSPLTIGLSGATPNQVSQILHGILAARHPGSGQILTWTNNAQNFADWLKLPKGGRFPGVIHVRVDTTDPTQTARDLESVRAAIDATTTRHLSDTGRFTLDFSEYTLVISSESNLRGRVRATGEEILGDSLLADAIQWIDLSCPSFLQSGF